MPIDEQELLHKLEQIREQAEMTLHELPARLAKDRLRLIIGLAKYLQTSIEMQAGPQRKTGNDG